MPTYQVTFEAEKLLTCRNYFAATIWECINKVILNNPADWVGTVLSIKIKRLRD